MLIDLLISRGKGGNYFKLIENNPDIEFKILTKNFRK